MARIRSIKPEFWTDEKLSLLDPLTRLVFLGLLSMADDAGRLVDNVKLLDGQLFPNTDDTCRDALDTLARLSRIARYTSASGQNLIQIINWEKHQKVDKPSKYVLPAPTPEQLAGQWLAGSSRESRENVAGESRDTRAPILDHGPRINDQPPAAPAGAEGGEPLAPPEPAAVPAEPPAADPPRRAKRRRAPAEGGDGGALAAFPKAACDALYERWLEKIGGVAYGRLRKELAPLWTSPAYAAPDDAARLRLWRDAIGAYAAWSADDPFEARNRSLTRFTQNARMFWHAAGLDSERYLAWLDSARPGLRRVS